MNNLIFTTGGDWDSTTLYNDGQEVLATELFLELHSGRDMDGDPVSGGVSTGGQFEAFLRLQDEPDRQYPLFPGRIKFIFPGHELLVENLHPACLFELTRVWYNGQDVTNHVMDVYVDIDADENVVKAYVTLFRGHWFSSDEVATYNIYG